MSPMPPWPRSRHPAVSITWQPSARSASAIHNTFPLLGAIPSRDSRGGEDSSQGVQSVIEQQHLSTTGRVLITSAVREDLLGGQVGVVHVPRTVWTSREPPPIGVLPDVVGPPRRCATVRPA